MRRLAVAAAIMSMFAGSARAFGSLADDARYVAQHGGIKGTGVWQATPRMISLSKALIIQRFMEAGQFATRYALCIVRHESGFNPGALNLTYSDWRRQAAGLAQIEVYWHPEYDRAKLLTDPAYAVNAFWRLSRGGSDWSAWRGGGYSCP